MPALHWRWAILFSLIVPSFAAAQTYTWVGATSNWNSAGNWSPTGVPNGATAQALFTGVGSSAVNISASVQAQMITFANPTGVYTLTSSAGQIVSGLTNITVNPDVTITQTINLANVATGSLLFTGSGPAALTITNNSTTFGQALVIGPNTVIGTPGSGGITVTGSGTTTISGTFTTNPANQVVGGLTQDGTGQLTLSGNGAALSGGIDLASGYMLWDYSTNTASKFGVIGNLTLGHGQLTLNAHATTPVTQDMPSGGGTIFNSGDMWMYLNTANGARAAITLNAGAITRVGPATANIFLDVGSTMTTTTGLTNGIIGPWAVVNHQTWATKSGSSIVGFTGFGTDVYAPGVHTDVTTGAGIPANFTTNTLRFNTPVSALLSGVNTVESGGILTSGTGYNSSISGGTLVNGSSEWILHSFGTLTINSSMVVNGRMILAGGNQLMLGGSVDWVGGAPLVINYGSVRFTNPAAFSSLTAVRFNNRFDSTQSLSFHLADGENAVCPANIDLTGHVQASSDFNVFRNAGLNSRVTLSGTIATISGQSSLYFLSDTSPTSGFHLTGANTFTGEVSVAGGVLGIESDANLGPTTNRLTLTAGGPGPGALEFLANGTGLARTLRLNAAGRVIVASGNTNSLDGVVTGAGSLNKFGTGTLVLNGMSNTYAGGTYVHQGRVTLGHGDAIPANTYIEVRNGAEFNTGGFSNTPANRPDLNLDGGTFRATASGQYHLRNLWMNGGAVDPSGAADFALRFGNGGVVYANNTAAGPARWLGSGNSRIVNDTGSPLPIYSFATYFGAPNPIGLDVDAIMAGSGPSQAFLVGGSGPLRITNPANTADFTVQQSTLRVDDVTTGGFGALGTGAIKLFFGGTLAYGGPSATLTKPIGVDTGFGGFRILNNGVNLTIIGGVTQTGASDTGAYFLGPMTFFASPDRATFTLPTNNSYAGGTSIHLGAIVEIDSLPDTGQPSPIGTGFAGPGSLVLGYLVDGPGELKITGTNPTYATNRDITVGGLRTVGAGGVINVANANTNLTLTGQIFNDTYTGTSSLSKTGPGTLTLANAVNSYTGGTYVDAGRLALGVGTAIPTGTNVTVFSGAEFNTNGLSNDATTAIGAVTLNGGMFRVPSGSPYYYLNKLIVNGAGAAIDLSGSTGITGLSLAGAGASISVTVNSTWTGPISSFVANGSNAELPFTIGPAVTLTSDLSLAVNGTLPPNSMRLTGGGTLYLRNAPQYVADLTVTQARLRLDDLTNVRPDYFRLTLDNGTLAYGGPTQSWPAAFTIGLNGGSVEVMSSATTLTLTGAIGNGGGPLIKSGPGTLILTNTSNLYTGGIIVNAGRLDVGNDNQLGQAAITVNPAGTIRFTNSTTTARNFTLFNGSMDVPTGVALTMNGANVFGGFLRGAGAYNLTGNTSLTGVTTFNTTNMSVTGPASISNFAHNGNLTVVAGQTLALNYATNGSGGLITVNGTATVSNFVSSGRLAINPGGNFTVTQGNTAFGGGSITTIGIYNPANGQVTPGGTLNIGPGDLRVQGGFVRNNGVITGSGNLIIDYLGLVRGAGEIDLPNAPIRINGGQLLAGNSPGLTRVSNFSLVSTGVTGGDFSNATGIAGPPIGSTGTQLSGWSVFEYGNSTNTGGSAVVEGTPAARAIWQFRTVLDSGDYSTPGVPANFNAAQPFTWQIVRPRSNADVGNPNNITPVNTVALISILDTATMQNVPLTTENLNAYLRFDDSLWNWGAVPVNERGTFAFVLLPDALGAANRVIGVTYTPVPEPVWLLAVLGGAGWLWSRRRTS